jgi:hypothetical protein
MAYMSDEGTPMEEKGRVMLALVGHAFVYLLLLGADAIGVVFSTVRVWRRREAGLTSAARTAVHKPTLAAVLGANLLYLVLVRLFRARLHTRSSGYAAGPPASS